MPFKKLNLVTLSLGVVVFLANAPSIWSQQPDREESSPAANREIIQELLAELEQAQGDDIKLGAARLRIARSLAKDAEPSKLVIPTLVGMLDDAGYWGPRHCSTVGEQVKYILVGMGPKASSAVPLLEKRLPTNNAKIKLLLGELAPDRYPLYSTGKKSVAPLTRVLRSGTPEQQLRAAIMLGNLGSMARPAIDALLASCDSEDLELRLASAQALWQIGRHPRSFEVVIRETQHPEVEVRRTVGKLLATMHWSGPNGPRNYRERLTVAMMESAGTDEPDMAVRITAAGALWRADQRPIALATWRLALTSDDSDARLKAVQSLRNVPVASEQLVMEIAGVLGDERAAANHHAAAILKKLGPKAKPALPLVETALQHENSYVRRCAERAKDAIVR